MQPPDDRGALRHVRHDVDDRPFIVIWEVTRACDLACHHCRAEARPQRHPGELSTPEGHRLLDDIADLGVPPPLLVLTGGDPFARPDLTDLVDHARGRGLSVALSPSVTPRLTRETLERLHAAGAKAVSLSLDGAGAALHDGFRGVDGVFSATLDAASWITELGLRLQINTTVTRTTVNELPALARRVHELGAFLWSVFFLVGTGRGRHLQPLSADETEDVLHWLVDVSRHLPVKTTEAPHFRRVVVQRRRAGGADPATTFGLGPTYRALRDALDTLDLPVRRRSPRPPLDVNAGRGFAFVSHVGDVYPSGFLPVSAGSVRERPLADLYRRSPLFRSLRDPDRLGGRCGRCEFQAVCGGSRSRAYAVHGDPLAEEPTCVHEPVDRDGARRVGTWPVEASIDPH